MAGPGPEPRRPEPGRRVSLRRLLPDGGQGDLVGFVLESSPTGVLLRDRRGDEHEVDSASVLAWRAVGVARGRDPLRTPLAELDRLAAAAGRDGRPFVARLSDLLDPLPPPPPVAWLAPPPGPAVLAGEWVTTVWGPRLLDVAWWASHHDARSIQARSSDADAAELERMGFRERTA